MSTINASTVEGKAPTLAQRTTQATAKAAQALGLPDAKRVAAAIAEVAADELAHNRAFAALVRARYELLAPRPPVRTTPRPTTQRPTTPRTKATSFTLPEDDLTPVRHMEGQRITLTGPVDPYFLLELYGTHQLRRALERHTLRKLQEASTLVQERNPGTRPTKRTDKAAIVEYIVTQVVK